MSTPTAKGETAMAKDKSRGKDKGKKKKKAQVQDKKKPEASKFGRLYDMPKKPQTVPTSPAPSSAPPPLPPTS
jgi:hypothetical protein